MQVIIMGQTAFLCALNAQSLHSLPAAQAEPLSCVNARSVGMRGVPHGSTNMSRLGGLSSGVRHSLRAPDDEARGHGANTVEPVSGITLSVVAVMKLYDAGNAATLTVGCGCELGGKWGTMRGMKFSLMIPVP